MGAGRIGGWNERSILCGFESRQSNILYGDCSSMAERPSVTREVVGSIPIFHPMKVIIAGGRSFDDYAKLCEYCDYILQNKTEVEIVSGTARGADKLGERYAKERGYSIKRFPADWVKHKKSAGYKRNAQMADYADGLIAFWDEESRGTMHMINLAREKGLKVRVCIYTPNIENTSIRESRLKALLGQK